jgi:hypothetical protein
MAFPYESHFIDIYIRISYLHLSLLEVRGYLSTSHHVDVR